MLIFLSSFAFVTASIFQHKESNLFSTEGHSNFSDADDIDLEHLLT